VRHATTAVKLPMGLHTYTHSQFSTVVTTRSSATVALRRQAVICTHFVWFSCCS